MRDIIEKLAEIEVEMMMEDRGGGVNGALAGLAGKLLFLLGVPVYGIGLGAAAIVPQVMHHFDKTPLAQVMQVKADEGDLAAKRDLQSLEKFVDQKSIDGLLTLHNKYLKGVNESAEFVQMQKSFMEFVEAQQ